MKYRQYKSGFTVVELLIVTIVIAVLAAVAIVTYNGVQHVPPGCKARC